MRSICEFPRRGSDVEKRGHGVQVIYLFHQDGTEVRGNFKIGERVFDPVFRFGYSDQSAESSFSPVSVEKGKVPEIASPVT